MYSTLVSVALFAALSIQGALAEFTVHTPTEITTCDPLKLSWDAVTGTKNYNVALVSSADPCETVLADLGDHSGTHITWDPTGLKAGDQVLISVLADDSDEGWSGAITVKECAKSSAASSASSASSAPASTGTTLVVNPAAAANTAPAAPSSSDAAQAVGAANSGVLGGGANGALSSIHFSASTLVLSAVAAVAALTL